MNYHNITKDDMLNGDGLRVVLWVAGCSHCCKECQNPITWDPDGGLLFDDAAKQEIFDQLDQDYIEGITFSGGDPLYKNNLEDVKKLITKIRKDYPNKNIWLYTGYTYEDIMTGTTEDMLKRQEIIKNIDILIDGPFIISKKDLRLEWRGSSNQRIIDMQETIKQNKIIEI